MSNSQIRVDSSNPENVSSRLELSKSTDGGKKFTSLQQGSRIATIIADLD